MASLTRPTTVPQLFKRLRHTSQGTFAASTWQPRPYASGPVNLICRPLAIGGRRFAHSTDDAKQAHNVNGKSCSNVIQVEDDRIQAEYLESLMTKAGELSLKFTIMDADGNVRTEQGTIHKSKLCREHDLDPRDLRKLDSMQPNLVPTILSRRTAIIVNMLHIRALIKADTVILFDPAGSVGNKLRDRLLWHLQMNVKAMKATKDVTVEGEEGETIGGDGQQGTRESMLEDGKRLSYEHRVLESILVSVAVALEEEMKYTREIVNDILTDLEVDINRENLRRLLHYSRRIAGFQSRAKYVLASIEEVLESDEDLSAMYLSAKKAQQPRSVKDHEELELLLESFAKQVEEIVSELETMTANLSTTQEVAELILDSNRNELIAMDLRVSIATMGLGAGALTSGVFGMNLTSHIEQNPYAFYIITGGAFIGAALITVLGLRRLRNLQRIGTNPNKQARASAVAKMRLGLWSKANTRAETASDPVYINAKADAARTRDAWRAEQIAIKMKMMQEKRAMVSRMMNDRMLSLDRR